MANATITHAHVPTNFFALTMAYFGLAILSCAGGVATGLYLLPSSVTANTGTLIVCSLITLALVFTSRSWSTHRLGYLGLIALAGLMGVTLVPLLAYVALTAGASIILQALLGAVAMYAGLAIYGATTERDLSGLGGFLIAGLIGMLAVSILTLILHLFGVDVWSNTIELVYSGFGILLFAGFTAYDFQKVRALADQISPIQAAINLFLDFILLFEYVLRFMAALNRK